MIIGTVNKGTVWAVNESMLTAAAINTIKVDWTSAGTKVRTAKWHWI